MSKFNAEITKLANIKPNGRVDWDTDPLGAMQESFVSQFIICFKENLVLGYNRIILVEGLTWEELWILKYRMKPLERERVLAASAGGIQYIKTAVKFYKERNLAKTPAIPPIYRRLEDTVSTSHSPPADFTSPYLPCTSTFTGTLLMRYSMV